MINFKEETLQALNDHGYSTNDIAWIATYEFAISVENFFEIADFEYDNGFGMQKINNSLIIFLKDGTWFERMEYIGAEWWDYYTVPEKPTSTVECNTFTLLSL